MYKSGKMTREISKSGGRGRASLQAILRYMLGRNINEEDTKTLGTGALLLEQRSKKVGART